MAAPTDPLGIDIACATDLDPNFRLCRGNENLSNALLRRLHCTEGALASIGDDPNYGYDVEGSLNLEVSDSGTLADISGHCRSQMLQDPRVQEALPQVIAAPDQSQLLVNVAGLSAQGPFSFVMPVGDVTVDKLKQGLPAGVPASQTDVVGQTVTVVSQSGFDGPAGPAGAPGTGGAGGASVEPDLDGLFAVDVTSESLLKEVIADFSTLPAGTLSIAFSAYARALGGSSGTFRLRLGGADGVADGTLLATISATSTSFQMVTAAASVENPLGERLVKLTGQSNTVGLDAEVKSTVALFSPG